MRPYDVLFEQALTRVDPERIHHAAFGAIRAARPLTTRAVRVPSTPVHALGLTFPHPLGLAAGFDKNAVGIDGLAALGFGHVEIGTVTGEPQPGNPRPRLFRLTADRAIVNRMGFNNDGAEVVATRLAAWRAGGGRTILGVNIGKSKVVPEHEAAGDYEKSAGLLAPYADYLVVNVSSPNTPGLRDLQAVEKLEPLLAAVRRRADEGEVRADADAEHAHDVLGALGEGATAQAAGADRLDRLAGAREPIPADRGVGGDDPVEPAGQREVGHGQHVVVAEVGRDLHEQWHPAIGAGGLSGRPLTQRSEDVVRLLRERVGPDLTLVGVGGIATVDDARRRLEAGADLLQGYTAFVYEGPLWPRRIVRGLARGE